MIHPHVESYVSKYRPANTTKHRDDIKWGYWLDPETFIRAHWSTEPLARNDAERYMREITKWLKANDLLSINYWPSTPGTFQIDDLNTLFVRWRKTHGKTRPTRLMLGRWEEEQLLCLGWSINYTREFYDQYTEAERAARYRKDSSEYWSAQWRNGNRYLPLSMGRDNPLDIQIANCFSRAELS